MLALVGGLIVVGLLAGTAVFAARNRDGSGPTGPGGSTPAAHRPGASGPGLEAGCRTAPQGATPPVGGTSKNGGVLRVGLREESDGFDPRRNGFLASALLEASTMYDPIAVFGDDGVIEPWLAEAITPNADFTEFTIRLHANVKFHDGRGLDAEAVRANFEESRANGLFGPAYAPVDHYTVTGPLTIVVSLKQSWPAYPIVLAGQFAYIGSPALIGTDTAITHPVGTGPFAFKEWKPGQKLTVKRNPDYWGGPSRAGVARLDSIEFRIIPDDTVRQHALQNGEIDALVAVEPEVIARLQGAGSRGTRVGGLELVVLNTSRPPFDDLRARRALAAATDQRALIAAQNSDLVVPASSPFVSTSGWCVEDTGIAPYDPVEARRLADDYARTNGHPLSFKLSLPSSGDSPRLAGRLVEMWGQAGIKAELVPGNRVDVVLSYIAGGYEAGLSSAYPPDDPDALFATYHTPLGGQKAPGAQLNLTRLSDPHVDTLLETGRSASDPVKRREAYRGLARALNDAVPVVYLYAEPQAIVAATRVHGVEELTAPNRPMTRPWAASVWLDSL